MGIHSSQEILMNLRYARFFRHSRILDTGSSEGFHDTNSMNNVMIKFATNVIKIGII